LKLRSKLKTRWITRRICSWKSHESIELPDEKHLFCSFKVLAYYGRHYFDGDAAFTPPLELGAFVSSIQLDLSRRQHYDFLFSRLQRLVVFLLGCLCISNNICFQCWLASFDFDYFLTVRALGKVLDLFMKATMGQAKVLQASK